MNRANPSHLRPQDLLGQAGIVFSHSGCRSGRTTPMGPTLLLGLDGVTVTRVVAAGDGEQGGPVAHGGRQVVGRVGAAGGGQLLEVGEEVEQDRELVLELRALFAELLPRLDTIELAGRPEWSATTFVGGIKHLPIRYSLRR